MDDEEFETQLLENTSIGNVGIIISKKFYNIDTSNVINPDSDDEDMSLFSDPLGNIPTDTLLRLSVPDCTSSPSSDDHGMSSAASYDSSQSSPEVHQIKERTSVLCAIQ